MADFEERLGRALEAGAAGAPDATSLAAAARTRAKARRRRAVVVGAAAAVVAITVSTALLAGGGDRGGTAPVVSDPDLGDDIDVTCGGGTSWPVKVMEGGLAAAVDDEEVRAAFAEVLVDAPLDAPEAIRKHGAQDAPYIVLAATQRQVTIGTGAWTVDGPGEGADVLSLEQGRVSSWGQCANLHVVLPQGRAQVELSAPPGGVAANTTTPTVQATERQCASGRNPEPHLSDPKVVEYGDRLVVTLTSETVRGGADCQGNPSVPIMLDLTEPLGDRELYDGGTWPPTPIEVADGGWQTVAYKGVVLNLPPDWDTYDCEPRVYRYGPPGACDEQRGVTVHLRALFDPAYGPGLRQAQSDGAWGGYVYVGNWAVSVRADERRVAQRILDSVREE